MYGKNMHIKRILDAYVAKYKSEPEQILFYDDSILNVYLSYKLGVPIRSYWISDKHQGLTRANLDTLDEIGNLLEFKTVNGAQLSRCPGISEYPYMIHRYNYFDGTLYKLYLPRDKDRANAAFKEFIKIIKLCNINIKILALNNERLSI